MTRWLVSLVLLLFVVLVPAASQAATVTVLVSGTITGVDPALAGTFSTGQGVAFSIVLDDAPADASPDPGVGLYHGGVVSLNGSIGSYTVAASDGTLVVHDNSLSTSNRDGLDASNFNSLSGSAVAGLPLYSVRVVAGSSNEFISGDDFPTLAELNGLVPVPGQFSGHPWNSLYFYDGVTVAGVAWSVDSMAVPEPSLAGLVGLGAVALVLGGRRNAGRR
jgi:hypothetical protein